MKGHEPSVTPVSGAARLARRIRLLTAATISWNLLEVIAALTAGEAAASPALIGFGLDSVVEVCSALAVSWQFAARDGARRKSRERLTLRVIGGSFLVLAAWVGATAAAALIGNHSARASIPGLLLAGASLLVMPTLSIAQRRAGQALGSRSAVADSRQGMLCTWLSAALLAGLALNTTLGWTWADPVAAMVIAAVAAKEGREAWLGRGCCAGPAEDRSRVMAEPATCTCCT